MIDGKQIHELIDKYLITPSELGKQIGKEDYEAMAKEINLLTEFPNVFLPVLQKLFSKWRKIAYKMINEDNVYETNKDKAEIYQRCSNELRDALGLIGQKVV